MTSAGTRTRLGDRGRGSRRRGAPTRLLAVPATAFALLLWTASSASAVVDSGSTITTLAGTHVRTFSGDGGPASSAALNEPRDTAVGPRGEIYVADTFNNRIRVIRPNGTISTFAGNGSHTAPTDPDVGDGGPATKAGLAWPHDVFADDAGNVFIADSDHNRIREVTTDGTIHTVAGRGAAGSTGDGGPAVDARLKNPKSVALHGGYLYTAGLDNKVRRIDMSSGVITTYAGTGEAGYANGPAAGAKFSSPQRLQIDSRGTVYVADAKNSAIRRIDPATHVVSTVAGTGVGGYNGASGQAVRMQLNQPRGIALEGDNGLYIADSNNQRIRRLNLTSGQLTTVAGTTRGYSGDGGPAGSARLYQPRGLTVTPAGDLIIADTLNSVLRIVTAR
jgi:sugar lactone lactonase YvrE